MRPLIKNIVNLRCKLIAAPELENPGFDLIIVMPGEVEISEELSLRKQGRLKMALLKFGLAQKIERAALLIYNKVTLPAIALQLHFSLVANLPNLFKKFTALNTCLFKNMKHKESLAMKIFNQETGTKMQGYYWQKNLDIVT